MKTTKIIYWVTTILFAGFMIFSAIPDIILQSETKQFMIHLGYPEYFIPFIGWAKLLGSIAILIPGFIKIKEWAYAGFLFAMSGAIFSHFAMGNGVKEMFGPLLLLTLTVVSWYFRPANRKIISIAIGTGDQ